MAYPPALAQQGAATAALLAHSTRMATPRRLLLHPAFQWHASQGNATRHWYGSQSAATILMALGVWRHYHTAHCGRTLCGSQRAARRSRHAPGLGLVASTARRAVATVAEQSPSKTETSEAAVEGTQTVKKPTLRFERGEDGHGIRSLTITTPLFYANGSPHIGSAYPTIAADVMARYARLHGAEVHFITGMDEHGEKIARTAADKGKTPQELVDGFATEFQDLWKMLSIRPDHFVRTSAPNHREIVNEFWQKCLDNGDIYKKDYEGWYCVGCEAFLDDDEMIKDHSCAIHLKKCELRKEENYFFRLSKYWDDIAKHVAENPDFILPANRKNEILAWLHPDNKRDLSISRGSTSWGIPAPGDDSQVIYVWFDALLGYLSSLLQSGDAANLETALSRGWPADIHVIGKDIMRFHTLCWPALLISAGFKLPKHICTHGFLTKDGVKMGKSLGNVVEPVPLVDNFGADAVRFFFAGCLSFGEDGDFSYEVFIKRVNAALANELGNLVHRILTLCRKNLEEPTAPNALFDSEAEILSHPVYQAAVAAPAEVASAYEQFNFTKAADRAMSVAAVANSHIMVIEPWKKLKGGEEDKKIALREMLLIAESIRITAVLLSPVTPGLSSRILSELGCPQEPETLRWKDTQWRWEALPGVAKGKKPTPVFQRIDAEPWKGK